jgi:hypothetical protein
MTGIRSGGIRLAARRIQQCTRSGLKLSMSAASLRRRRRPNRLSSTSGASATPAAASRSQWMDARGSTATCSKPAACRLAIMSVE